MEGMLYLVGTPIGNMADITLRALDTLKAVDVIACEDTRRSRVLLTHYGIKKPLISCYKEKEYRAAEDIARLLGEGKSVALITDAGMPCVSDPGAAVVSYVRERGYGVTVIPGATAAVSAMCLTGITKYGFAFLGFLPDKNKEKDALVKDYVNIPVNLIFYSSPHNINADLEYLASIFGGRNVHVVKELTKIYESAEKYVLTEAHIDKPRGEYVLIVEGAERVEPLLSLTPEEHLRHNMLTMDKKEAVKITAKERGVSRDEIYKLALDIE